MAASLGAPTPADRGEETGEPGGGTDTAAAQGSPLPSPPHPAPVPEAHGGRLRSMETPASENNHRWIWATGAQLFSESKQASTWSEDGCGEGSDKEVIRHSREHLSQGGAGGLA